jgi:GGDEF domain-containing protein
MGIGTYPEDGLYSDELTEYADMALYAGKAQGRNRVCLAPISNFSLKKKIH